MHVVVRKKHGTYPVPKGNYLDSLQSFTLVYIYIQTQEDNQR